MTITYKSECRTHIVSYGIHFYFEPTGEISLIETPVKGSHRAADHTRKIRNYWLWRHVIDDMRRELGLPDPNSGSST
jgi:hypothetical protein